MRSIFLEAPAPGVAWRWFLGPLTLAVGGGLELRFAWQRLVRDEADRVEAAGFASQEQRRYSAFGPRAWVRASLPISDRLSAAAGVTASLLGRSEAQESGVVRIGALPLLGLTLGLGYVF